MYLKRKRQLLTVTLYRYIYIIIFYRFVFYSFVLTNYVSIILIISISVGL